MVMVELHRGGSQRNGPIGLIRLNSNRLVLDENCQTDICVSDQRILGVGGNRSLLNRLASFFCNVLPLPAIVVSDFPFLVSVVGPPMGCCVCGPFRVNVIYQDI